MCLHTFAWSNSKYFCKDPCKTPGDVLVRVQSGQKAESGRISLADWGNGVFVVNITRLQLSDSGLYWCGVDRTAGDTFIRVYLTVNKGMWTHRSSVRAHKTWLYFPQMSCSTVRTFKLHCYMVMEVLLIFVLITKSINMFVKYDFLLFWTSISLSSFNTVYKINV